MVLKLRTYINIAARILFETSGIPVVREVDMTPFDMQMDSHLSANEIPKGSKLQKLPSSSQPHIEWQHHTGQGPRHRKHRFIWLGADGKEKHCH